MESDTTAGLDYDRARFYDPVNGRFVSPDPLGYAGGGENLYSYVRNNPTRLVDPLGLMTEQEEKTLEQLFKENQELQTKYGEAREEYMKRRDKLLEYSGFALINIVEKTIRELDAHAQYLYLVDLYNQAMYLLNQYKRAWYDKYNQEGKPPMRPDGTMYPVPFNPYPPPRPPLFPQPPSGKINPNPGVPKKVPGQDLIEDAPFAVEMRGGSPV